MTRTRTTIGRVFRLTFIAVACLSFLLNAAVIGVGLRAYQSGLLKGGEAFFELPREDRRALVAALRRNAPELAPLRADLQAKRAAMIRALAEDAPDPERVRAAMAEVRAATARLQQAAQETMLEEALARAARRD